MLSTVCLYSTFHFLTHHYENVFIPQIYLNNTKYSKENYNFLQYMYITGSLTASNQESSYSGVLLVRGPFSIT